METIITETKQTFRVETGAVGSTIILPKNQFQLSFSEGRVFFKDGHDNNRTIFSTSDYTYIYITLHDLLE